MLTHTHISPGLEYNQNVKEKDKIGQVTLEETVTSGLAEAYILEHRTER